MAAEHETYCMDHKPAHEPKVRCEVILANNRQCRNWACTGTEKCVSHTPKKSETGVRQALQPHIAETQSQMPGRYWNVPRAKLAELKTTIKVALQTKWLDQEAEHGIQAISTSWMAAEGGVPALVVKLPKERNLEFSKASLLQHGLRTYLMTVEQTVL